VTTALIGSFTVSYYLDPAFVTNVINPKVVQLFRAIVFATENVHIAIVDRRRVAAARARQGLSLGDLDVLPSVRREVVDSGLAGSTALLETAKDDHV